MTAASNSEASKRASGIAASVQTTQEPTPTLGDAPGADSEALAAREALAELLAAWCDRPGCAEKLHEQHFREADLILGSSWLADHDRQTAAAAWFAGYDKGNLDGYFGTSDERAKSPYSDLDPYSEEARRG